MEIKCPKCRYKFDEDIAPGIMEKACVCPRCGTPFIYKCIGEANNEEQYKNSGGASVPPPPPHANGGTASAAHTDAYNDQGSGAYYTQPYGQQADTPLHASPDGYADLRKHLSGKEKLKHQGTRKPINWKNARRTMVIVAAIAFVLLMVLNKCMGKDYSEYDGTNDASDETATFVRTNVDNSTSVEKESETISDENKWIEGSWSTPRTDVEFTFSIRGNQISITDGLDYAVNGTFTIKGNRLMFQNYTFRLDKEHEAIWFNGVKYEQSHFY